MYHQILIINSGRIHYLNINGKDYLNQVKKLLKTKQYDVYCGKREFYTVITKYRFYVPTEQVFSLKDSLEIKDIGQISMVVICFDSQDRIKNYDEHFTKIFSQNLEDHQKPISEWLISLGFKKEKAGENYLNLSPRKLKKEKFITSSFNQFNTIPSI